MITVKSGVQLRRFLDSIRKDLTALKMLYILKMSLDYLCRIHWQKRNPTDKFAKKFLTLLQRRCQILETINSTKNIIKVQVAEHNSN